MVTTSWMLISEHISNLCIHSQSYVGMEFYIPQVFLSSKGWWYVSNSMEIYTLELEDFVSVASYLAY